MLRAMNHDEIVNKCVLALAREHALTVPETLAALDRHPIEIALAGAATD
jgi:hypothetical protein